MLEIAPSIDDRIVTIVNHALSTDRNFSFCSEIRTSCPARQDSLYSAERHKFSVLITEVLNDGAKVGLIRDDLNFELLAETLLGMMRGITATGARMSHRRKPL
jgi:hypothetical protein